MTATGSGTGIAAPADDRPATATPPPPGRLDFGRLVAGLVLITLGTVWLLDVLDVARFRASVVLPALLTAVGVGLMIGSFRGPHPSLITVGILLAVATVFSALVPPEALRGGIGERTYVVDEVTELEPRYRVGLGDLTLDLSRLRLEDHRRVELSVGAGDLLVVVPPETVVTVDASLGAGEIVLFDETANGISVHRTFGPDDPGPAGAGPDGAGPAGAGPDGAGSLELHVDGGAGRIEVRR
ncbi:MAG: hypothetical protein ACFCVK_09290 [Acidimicrobiales bacterium]